MMRLLDVGGSGMAKAEPEPNAPWQIKPQAVASWNATPGVSRQQEINRACGATYCRAAAAAIA